MLTTRRPLVAQTLAGLRALLVFTVICGILYPAAVLAIGQLPGLKHRADGSQLESGGRTVGSSLIGQAFTDADGNALKQYFQSRPSAAGDGYDPTSTSASNLGPESVVDTLPDASDPDSGAQSLLTQVCARSAAVGTLEGVDGARPYCAAGVGAVLAVFHADGLTGAVTRVVSVNQACPAAPFVASYQGVTVECAQPGEDWSTAVITPVRGGAAADPSVPADAVTASGSGLDPGISPAYARLQEDRVAAARGVGVDVVRGLVEKYTTGRALGFIGEPVVNVVELNHALDQRK